MMRELPDMVGALLNSMAAQVALVDEEGTIVGANQGWLESAAVHPPSTSLVLEGPNYLQACEGLQGRYREPALAFAAAVRDVLAGRRDEFSMEYPCAARTPGRWYHGRVARLQWQGAPRALVSHEDVTESRCADRASPAGDRRFRAVLEQTFRTVAAKPQEQAVALSESRERLCLALAASGTGTFRWEISSDTLERDGQMDRLFGIPTDVTPRRLDDFLARVHPEDRAAVRASVQECATRGGDFDLEFRVIHPDGRVHWLADKGMGYVDDAGRPLYLTGACVDITRSKRAEQSLRDSEDRFRQLVENAADAFFLSDLDGRIVDVNRRACDSLGFTRDELLGMGIQDIEIKLGMHEILQGIGRGSPGETVTAEGMERRRDGTTFPVEIRCAAFASGSRRLVLALVRDITERKRAASQLEYQATHDTLTGLLNRAHFHVRMATAVVAANTHEGTAALLLIDLDRFKEINDAFGHHSGDSVLKIVSTRLRAGLRGGDQVARLGGDEFAILLPGADRAEAIAVTQRVLMDLSRPIEVDGRPLDIGASVGIALFPDHAQDAHSLLQRADAAMYQAKRSRAGWAVFDFDHSHGDPRRLALIADMRRAIEEGQFLLHYQPLIDLKTGHVRGVEALARWVHPTEGMIPPGRFIPLAEHTGLIRPLGLWVLDAAIRQGAEWKKEGLDLSVAVNLAADNLQDPQFYETLSSILASTGADPGRLTLEVTESAMMAYPDRAKQVLGLLRAVGVRVSIDDFGTGYSSLSYLKELPVDEVKVDKGFIKDVTDVEQAASITRAVIELGHSLGLDVVAKGVEDRPTRDLVAAWGCDTGQGYYFGRALPATEFRNWLRQSAGQPGFAGVERRAIPAGLNSLLCETGR